MKAVIILALVLGMVACNTRKPSIDPSLFPESADYKRGFKDGFHQGVAEGVLMTQSLP